MKTHIFEHRGVLLSCDYHYRPNDTLPDFTCVRVLGEDYKATGPNLLPLLVDVMLARRFLPNGTCQAEQFFSAVVGDME